MNRFAARIEQLPIDQKLLWMSVVATGAALLLCAASLVTYDLLTFRDTLHNRLVAFADILGRNSASAVLFNDATSASQTLASLTPRANITAAALFNAHGELFAHWARNGARNSFNAPPSQLDDRVSSTLYQMEIFHPVVLDGSHVSTVYIQSNLSERNRRLMRYLVIIFFVSGLSVALAAGVSRPMGRLIAAPILNLVHIAHEISEKQDFSIRADVPAGEELALFVQTFNEMLGRIQASGYVLQKAHDELEQKVIERTEELHRKEEELYQSRKLESIGRLAGGVAHDFNNLLTGILGCAESLEAEIPTDSPARIDVEEIKRASERAAALTRQLLAFGRKQIIRPTSIDLNALVKSTGTLLRRLIGEDIIIAYELQPDLGHLRADAGQLDQLLINLAVNARDAMPKGGKLLIRTSQVVLDGESDPRELPAGQYIMLSISDTGVGMTRDVQSKIFEPFLRRRVWEKGRASASPPSMAWSNRITGPF